MTDEIVVPSEGARKKPFILFTIAQWVVAAFFGVAAIAASADVSKLGIPGAPIALYWSGLAALILAAVVLSPPLFFRLPRLAKIGSYACGFAAIMLFGTYVGQMRSAYERTPAGAAEVAERARTEALLAKLDAESKKADAEVDQINKELAKAKAAPEPSSEDVACQAFVKDITALAKEKNNLEIFEIDSIRPGYNSIGKICQAVAVTDRGTISIEFGTETTPQGQTLLSLSFPNGI